MCAFCKESGFSCDINFYMQTYRKLNNNCYWKLHNDVCVGVTMCPMVPP